MSGILDRCVWLATSSGTGSFVDAGAVLGYQDMAAAGSVDGQTYSYAAQSADLSQWEVGLGTWTAGSVTLARTTIYFNSLGTTAAVNFTNPPQVLVTMGAVAMRSALATEMGGRLTLTSGTPVLNANATAQGTVYYTPYLHSEVSCWDGVGLSALPFTEMSVVLDATNYLSGKLYDWFIFLNAGVPTLGYGPAWTSITSRSAALTTSRPLTNNATITLRTASGTTFSIGANQAVYVGTTYGTANAQTAMNFLPTAAAGGNNSILGVFNAYNRVPMRVVSRDSTASWTYATATWRAANGNANNAVNFVDGLGEVLAYANYVIAGGGTAAQSDGLIGINLNSTSAAPGLQAAASSTGAAASTFNAPGIILPALGFNTLNAVELANGVSFTFYGSGFDAAAGQAQALLALVSI